MKFCKRLLPVLGLILLLAALTAVLGGCGKKSDVDTSGMYLVVYDGNGGFLGDKTRTVRKLFCYPGSKIPGYPSDYTPNQYTVSSLGLATRQGYNLLGWYTSAEYTLSATGDYLELKTEDGYGIFESKAGGTYVYKPVADEAGSLIYIYMEPSKAAEDAEPDTYILLVPQYDGENQPLLTVAPGFYICNSEADCAAIEDETLRQFYTEAYAAKVYTKAEAEKYGGYRSFAELTAAEQTTFADFPRYTYRYLAADAGDEGLDHYALVSGHASLFDLFVDDEAGEYVEKNGGYVKATAEDAELRHYKVADRFVFTGDTTEGMARYGMVAHYWDFANNHVTEDQCQWDGEKYVLRLYAHWEKKLTVNYHYENGTGQVDEATTKLLDDNITEVSLHSGQTIGRKEIVPLYAGHTFVGWSKSATVYDPWDFADDVFPEGTISLDLYAYYVEGEYTRIVSAKGLAEIGKNPAGKYLIVNDLDLGGATLTTSPFGLTDAQVFTGEILSFGRTISNFTLKLSPQKNKLASEEATIGAPIPVADGAKISGLNLSFTIACDKLKGMGSADKTVYLAAAGLIGKELDGESASTIRDCNLELNARPLADDIYAASDTAYTYQITVGDLVAVGIVTAENCHSMLNADGKLNAGMATLTLRQTATPA